MKKLHIIAASISMVLTSAVFAGQHVTVSLTNDLSSNQDMVLSTSFESTDYFEAKTYNREKQGTVTRTYYHGPKHITFYVDLNKKVFFDTNLSGCSAYLAGCYHNGDSYRCESHLIDTLSDQFNINVRVNEDNKLFCSVER